MAHNGTGYYIVMTENNTKYGNIDSHSELQDGHQVLNNTGLTHLYHNEGLTPKYGLKCDFSHFEFRVSQET